MLSRTGIGGNKEALFAAERAARLAASDGGMGAGAEQWLAALIEEN